MSLSRVTCYMLVIFSSTNPLYNNWIKTAVFKCSVGMQQELQEQSCQVEPWFPSCVWFLCENKFHLHNHWLFSIETFSVWAPVSKQGPKVTWKLLNDRHDCNGPFPSWRKPLYQNETWCPTIHMNMSVIRIWMKSHFVMKGRVPRLTLSRR